MKRYNQICNLLQKLEFKNNIKINPPLNDSMWVVCYIDFGNYKTLSPSEMSILKQCIDLADDNMLSSSLEDGNIRMSFSCRVWEV